MKKLLMLMLVISSTMAFTQKVSDYKYVVIPEKFKTFKNSSFGLEAYLAKGLQGKKYEILTEAMDKWPSEARNNSCNVINAEVLNDKSLFTNKVILQFKDCNKKVILESKGRSDIKEFEEGFPDALKQALTHVPLSSPVEMKPAKISDAAENVQNTVSETVVSAGTPEANNYSNGKLNLQKIQIDSNQFILAKSGSSVPFAVFKTTSKSAVFLVKMADGNTTIGYFENGNIVIDIPQADGKFSKEVFVAK
ncbi:MULTISPECIES: hypothetical protein [unclassified Chryseobacterium]|uniref:hypothetical protein n=1 Tax=unclassified Chryseobacterium TaxID=2593645 RepID=UPI000D709486|nr:MULTISPECIES: hypothetical protein [unclassified Chryseobacterium]PWW15271.1 hypothetical protein DEU40_13810 [Chryseobacterium sp. AG844]